MLIFKLFIDGIYHRDDNKRINVDRARDEDKDSLATVQFMFLLKISLYSTIFGMIINGSNLFFVVFVENVIICNIICNNSLQDTKSNYCYHIMFFCRF